MAHFSRVVPLLLVAAGPALAQPATGESRPLTFSIALGPSHAFRGVDSKGVQGQAAITHALGHGFGLRLEGTGHWYEQQPLYPCLVQDADRCYQTMRRAVGAGLLNVTYHLNRYAGDKGHTVPYLITGVGVYRSRRIATHYPDCPPQQPCIDRGTYKLEFRDAQLGWSGGVGLDFDIGPVAAFSELRLHYIYNDKPGAQPSNDYFLWPLSVGFRF
jgi:hypothetical protein